MTAFDRGQLPGGTCANSLGIGGGCSTALPWIRQSWAKFPYGRSNSRRAHALRAAMGVGVGGLVFALAALIGLNAVFKAVPTLYLASKALGGAYLCYLGLRLWRSASRPLGWGPADMPSERSRSAFLLGFATQISHPKTAVVYASVFAAFMPAAPTPLFEMALVTMVFFIEAGWYALLATTLAAQAPRTVYLRLKTWLDRCAGGILCALALGLVRSAIQR